MLIHEKLKGIAQKQYGYFSAAQAEKAGYVNQNQFYHLKKGNWLWVDRGIFRLPGYPDSLESEMTRCRLWGESGRAAIAAVLSHESALHWYQLGARPQEIHLTVLVGCRRKAPPGCILHYACLRDGEYGLRDGMLCTSLHRTIRDLLPDLRLRCAGVSTIRAAFAQRLLSAEEAQHLEMVVLGAGGAGAVPMPGAPAERPLPACPAEERADGAMGSGAWGREESGMTTGTRRRGFAALCRSTEWNGAGRSFTLIEMLVVIAIICVLAGMLMPAMQKAVESGRQAACGNNLRQCGMGVYQYADVSGGYTINLDGKGHTATNWPDQLMATGCLPDITTFRNTYMGAWSKVSAVPAGNVFSCPSTPPPARHTASGTAFTNGAASSALCYGVRFISIQYRYPGESMTYLPVVDTVELRFRTVYTKAPFLGDSIKLLWGPDNVPGQGTALGFDQSSYSLNYGGSLYIGHGTTGNAWYPDGHVDANTQEEYLQMRVPYDGMLTSNSILAYPCLR